MEHRRGQRKSVALPARIEGRRLSELQGEIVDMSVGGAFIKLEGLLPAPNTIVRLCFSIPDTVHNYECRALVVRRNGDGIGVMFDRRQDPLFVNSACTTRTVSARKANVKSARKPPATARKTPDHVAAAVD